MNPLHPWRVNVEEAIQIQEALRGRLTLKNTFKEARSIGGADVAYSEDRNVLFAAIVVLSFPKMETMDSAIARGEIPFPYIPGLLSFREGPILIKAFQNLKIKPDVMIFEGQGIAHPRGFGLASHMGLWLDLPSIGCTKTPLLDDFTYPGSSKGSFELIRKEGKEVGAVLRTKENVKPLFISSGHRVDLQTSIQIVLTACPKFRIPEPLRRAHQLSQFFEGMERRKAKDGEKICCTFDGGSGESYARRQRDRSDPHRRRNQRRQELFPDGEHHEGGGQKPGT